MAAPALISGNIEFDQQFSRAYDLLENSRRNIFITGKAGTGKSTLLQYFRAHTSKRVVVLAPTGVAAVNVQGQTIHSFFRFKPDITPETVPSIRIRKAARRVYKNLDAVVIDEISMVRADLLDCMDGFLRLHGPKEDAPFGGVQMIFFGDLYQLPPVVAPHDRQVFTQVYLSPYFFDAKSFRSLNIERVELNKIYRQKEEDFIRLLSAVRDRSVTSQQMNLLNQRVNGRFEPPSGELYVYLTTTNAIADKINQEELAKLPSVSFYPEGEITNDFDKKVLPTQQILELKHGAQVMLLNNDSQGRWVNGSLGKIVSTPEEWEAAKRIRVELSEGRVMEVAPFTWEMFHFFYSEELQAVEARSVGSFKQYPLKLAWAMTIHKSQGKTFSKVVLDIGNGAFAPGQVYVALSRCTSFDGLVLKRPILRRHILLDGRVARF